MELNPMLNGVAAGFNRRRRYDRFKYGHQTLELDKLRFAYTASEKDSDIYASEVKEAQGSLKNKKRSQKEETRWSPVCSFFQRQMGCNQKAYRFAHKCSICYRFGHGAIDCFSRRSSSTSENNVAPTRRQEARNEKERPPDPRHRRARAVEM